MKKIKSTTLALAMFHFFLILFFATTVQAEIQEKVQDGIKNTTCSQFLKEFQIRIQGLKKVHKGMYNAISSSLPLDRIDRYNRHINILDGNLNREVKRIKGLLEKLQQQDKKCKEIAKRLSPDINKVYEIRASVHEAIFNSNTSNYKKLVEKLGSQVKSLSGKL